MEADSFANVPPLELTEGGPGDAVMRRLGLAPLRQRAGRAALVLAAVSWVPLFVLSAFEGVLTGGPRIPFLYDIAAHVRFLIAVPILLLAELPIGARLRGTTAHFLVAGLVRPEDHPRFAALVTQTLRMRDSRLAELIVLAAAYATTYGLLSSMALRGGTMWYAPLEGGGLTGIGWWYAFVSIPIFQFLGYRWIYRMLVWVRFLRRVARLDLQLTPTHPDGAGGLGFLGKGNIPFGVLLFAISAVVASAIASHVLFAGAHLETFYASYGALLLIASLVFIGPLLVFVPRLIMLKQKSLLAYGTLASRYTQLFDRKWVQGIETVEEPLLGTADIQSLADLGNSYALVKNMRTIPFELRDLLAMIIPGLIPALPLAATVMPVSEILKQLLHLLA